MIKTKALILFFIFFTSIGFAQKQADWWYFGEGAGVTFTSGVAQTVTNGAIHTSEGCSSMSDASGNLLFYTDGRFVYTSTHTVMANGSGLLGDISTTQAAVILAKPGSSNIYYIFTLPEEGVGNFCYSEVDMSLSSGSGSVTVKNTVLKGNVTEKLSAVRHCNGIDLWVTIHELGTNAFYTYPVTSAGVGSPVISNVGQPHFDVHGQMKFNTAGSKLACARDTIVTPAVPGPYTGKGYLDLFNFDNTTGIIYGAKSIFVNQYQLIYGVEFSPDNSKLYATFYNISGATGDNYHLVQFDLTAASIASSAFNVYTVVGGGATEQLRALQVARDGKIYMAEHPSPFLSVVNSPNLAGAACSYSDNVIDLDPLSLGTQCRLGLPGFLSNYFNPTFPATTPCIQQVTTNFSHSDTIICKGDCINFNDLSTGTVTSWSWVFPGGTPSVSAVQNPSTVCFASAGTYTVKLISSNGASSDSAKKVITVNNCTVQAVANFMHSDTVICSGSCINFTDLSSGAVNSWQWSFPGGTPSVSSVQNPTVCYNLPGTHFVSLLVSNGNSNSSATHSISVTSASVNAGPSHTLLLNGNTSATLTGSGNATSYTWSPATGLSTTNSLVTQANPNATTVYTLTGMDANGCRATSTTSVFVDETCGELFVPTAFSPNNDGQNDLECVLGSCIAELQFVIYDRWGEKVFETSDLTLCWDGEYKGKLMNTGIYVYHVVATLKNGELIDKKGNIHLIR